MKKIVIIAGGIPPSKQLLLKEITKNSIIIAADGGANCLWKYKIVPNYLVGDWDSISGPIIKPWERKNVAIETYPQEKDQTDGKLALKKAISLNAKTVTLLGCTGGRIDHLLGALGLLNQCSELNIKASLKDDLQTIFLIKESAVINGQTRQIFSLQAYGETVNNLSISGAKYPLKNYNLSVGDSLTISNEFKDRKVNIQFTSGKLLLIIPSTGCQAAIYPKRQK